MSDACRVIEHLLDYVSATTGSQQQPISKLVLDFTLTPIYTIYLCFYRFNQITIDNELHAGLEAHLLVKC